MLVESGCRQRLAPIASRTRCRRSSPLASTTSHLMRRRCSSADPSSGGSSGRARSSISLPTSTEHEALARRPPAARVPAPRAALVDLGRDGVPLQARADPRGRIHGHGEARAGAVPRPLRGVARRAHGRGARSRSARTTSIGPSSSSPSSRARRPRSSRTRPASALVKAAKTGDRPRGVCERAQRSGCGRSSCVPRSRARYVAARAAWRLQDCRDRSGRDAEGARPGARERGRVVRGARAHGARGGGAQARRRSGAGAGARRRGARDPRREEDDPVARFDALSCARDRRRLARLTCRRTTCAYMERAYALAIDAGRKDLQTIAAQALAQAHIVRARARRGRAPAHARARARRRERERPRALRARRSRTAGS